MSKASKDCECEKFTYYKYYDTPDGCDIYKKTIVTSRYGLITGLILSTYDVLMFSHPVGLRNILRRYASHTVPLTLIGATFSIVANSLVNVRKKDDVLNYLAGGVACGPLVGWYFRSLHGWFLGSIALGCIAMTKKTSIEEGWVFFPVVPHSTKTANSVRNDFTLLADPRDEWRRNCEKHK